MHENMICIDQFCWILACWYVWVHRGQQMVKNYFRSKPRWHKVPKLVRV